MQETIPRVSQTILYINVYATLRPMSIYVSDKLCMCQGQTNQGAFLHIFRTLHSVTFDSPSAIKTRTSPGVYP